MTHSDEYRKPEVTRIIVTRVFGEGILFVEGTLPRFSSGRLLNSVCAGEAHRKQV